MTRSSIVLSHHLTAKLQRLYRLHAAGIKFGLDAELNLLGRLGNPQHGLRIIHVAGTNGKGSVCAMLEAILRRAGLKTGLYTSPHLVRVNERIQVAGECIPDADLAGLIDLVDAHARSYAGSRGGREITFFEFLTALAFEHFRRSAVEAVVLETGMGGRLDATNVAAPQVTAITGISIEHTAYLGNTLAAIAAEKGGIVKPHVPLVTGRLPEEARAVLLEICRAKQSRMIPAEEAISITQLSHTLVGQKIRIESLAGSYGTVMLPLLGSHQMGNAAIAIAAFEVFCSANNLEPPPEIVGQGLAKVAWPGRLQLLKRNPDTIVDGAHNPEGALVLNKALEELFRSRALYLILGMCADKDAEKFLGGITVPVKRCWAVGLENERGLLPAEMASLATRRGWKCSASTVPEALDEASALALGDGGFVCAAGSLFLAGEIMRRYAPVGGI